ncbi:MAG: hypothetical protein EXR99_09580 [Gemmataceae bacterium]|nr:hypothetical protein [Gemmataceae bacterium]
MTPLSHFFGALAWLYSFQGLAQANPQEVFGLTRVHQFHFTVSAKDYPAMDPPPRANPFGPGAAGQPVIPPADRGAGNFGFEFPYVHAAFQAENKVFKDIGLRYKGSGTYMVSSRLSKRSLKIDLDRFDASLAFHGLTKLNLNSSVMDPSKIREALAFEVFRAAGVMAPRTAFAEVFITVPGKFDKEFLGLYTLVEQVDEEFLKRNFQNGKGLLLKPEGIRGVPFLGDDPAAYQKTYNPKSKEGNGNWKGLVEFTRLVNKGTDAEFQNQIAKHLDVDSFVRFLAANTLLASMDGFIGLGHNFYLYQSPDTGKFTFIPWDLDLAFGSFNIFGNGDQLADLSIEHPHLGENKLIDRLLAMPNVKSAYREQLKRLLSEVFTKEKLGKDLELVESATKELVAKEKKAVEGRKEGGGFGIFFSGGPGVKVFMEKRVASARGQLEGNKKGFVPAFGPPAGMGKGPAIGPGRPGGPGVGAPLARPFLNSLDANKDGQVTEAEFATGMKVFFSTWDKDKNGALDQEEIAEGLQKLQGIPVRPSPLGQGK